MMQLDQIYQIKPNTAFVLLEMLNIRDLTVFIPKLAKFKYMDTLSLNGNKLTSLPNMEMFTQLRQIDLTANPIKIDNNLMDTLFTLPNLQHLLIDFKNQQQKDLILQNLPRLKYLNEKMIQRKKVQIDPKQQEMQVIRQKLAVQQKHAKQLLNNVYSMLDDSKAPPDASEDFNFNMKVILQEFDYFYDNINSSLAKQCVYLYYKNRIYQVLDTHLSAYLQDNGYQGIAAAIQQINKCKKQGFQQILKVGLSHAYHQDFTKKTIQNGNKLRKQTLYQNQITRLKKKVAQLSTQNLQIQNMNERYLQQTYNKSKSRKGFRQVTPRSRRAKDQFGNQINDNKVLRTPRNTSYAPTPMSRQQSKHFDFDQIQFNNNSSKRNPTNQRDTDNAFKRADYPNNTPQRSPTHGQSNVKRKQYRQIEKSPSYRVLPSKNKQNQKVFEKTQSMGSLSAQKMLYRGSSKPMLKDPSSRSIYKNPSSKSINKYKNTEQNQQEKMRTSKQTVVGGDRKITLDQMVQFIDDFIYQKGKFNIQCYNKGQIFQTPQQFLYTYFLRKYGLKDLALQWSLLIIKAIQKFNKQNVIVQIFGKILKNSLQEQFYQICKDFKQFVAANVPLKDKFDVHDMQSIFYSVFKDSYRQDFQKFLSQKIDHQTIKGQKFYFRRSMIYYLQQYFIKKHQKQIQKYYLNFRQFDTDDDGIIENQQIQRCILNFIKKYSQAFLTYNEEQSIQKTYQSIINKRKKKGNLISMTFSEFYQIMRGYF